MKNPPVGDPAPLKRGMADRGINESEVYRFIHEKIDTVPHLEALLQLRQSGPRKWTEEQLARRLFISTETAGKILRDLARLQLVGGGG